MVELLLFEAPKCHVFKLPNKKVGGHKAEEWEGCNIWTGLCRVYADDETCVIRLEDETGKLFAECPVHSDRNTKSVEPVTDSSRYFVLRVEDKSKGHHAFIGIGFEERSQAFDFSVSLTDFKKSVQQMREMHNNVGKNTFSDKVYEDLSLKSGQKITVDLSGKIKGSESTKAPLSKGGLAPPPKSSRQVSTVDAKTGQTSCNNNSPVSAAQQQSATPSPFNTSQVAPSTNLMDDMFSNKGPNTMPSATLQATSTNTTSLDDLFRAF